MLKVFLLTKGETHHRNVALKKFVARMPYSKVSAIGEPCELIWTYILYGVSDKEDAEGRDVD